MGSTRIEKGVMSVVLLFTIGFCTWLAGRVEAAKAAPTSPTWTQSVRFTESGATVSVDYLWAPTATVPEYSGPLCTYAVTLTPPAGWEVLTVTPEPVAPGTEPPDVAPQVYRRWAVTFKTPDGLVSMSVAPSATTLESARIATHCWEEPTLLVRQADAVRTARREANRRIVYP